MKRWCLLFSFCSPWILCLEAQALPKERLAVHFFRSPEAPFPSGQTNLLTLRKSQKKGWSQTQFWGSSGNLKFLLDRSEIVLDQDLLEAQASPLESSGFAYFLTDQWIKKDPHPKSDPLLQALEGDQLKILMISEGYAKVEKTGFTGWVHLSSCLTRYDFASFVMNAHKQWLPVKFRQGPHLILQNGQRIALEHAKALLTQPDLAISKQQIESKKISKFQHFRIQQTREEKWNISEVKGHGTVFWRAPSGQPSEISRKPQFISTEVILKKPIYSVAVHPTQPQTALVSADGVFLTRDGQNWEELKDFKNQNVPVAISQDHEFFVGNLRSRNQGKSFLPFFQFERIATLISETQRGVSPRQLKISSLEILPENRIRMTIDSGTQKIPLMAKRDSFLIQKWDVY
ncbi:MAG: hypothetical protein ACK5P6_04355 [Pseudobdellovibrionaceae bacterium]